MSSVSSAGILYVIRDRLSSHWFDLITEADALLLVEEAVYRQPTQLPPQTETILALKSDVVARNTHSEHPLIDHHAWVELTLHYAQTVRL